MTNLLLMKLDSVILRMLAEKSGADLTTASGATVLGLDIENVTGERLSVNTVKRLVGILSGDQSPRPVTLDIIARYLGFGSYEILLKDIHDKISAFNLPDDFIDMASLSPDTVVRLEWSPGRIVEISHIGDGKYRVEKSVNSKLEIGDIIVLSVIAEKFPLRVKEVLRNGKNLGNYTAAPDFGLSGITINKTNDK